MVALDPSPQAADFRLFRSIWVHPVRLRRVWGDQVPETRRSQDLVPHNSALLGRDPLCGIDCHASSIPLL